MGPEAKRLIRRLLCHPQDVIYNLLQMSETNPLDGAFFQLRNAVLALPDRDFVRYREEIEFLNNQTLGYFDEKHLFPYEFVREKHALECGLDAEWGLPYVLHDARRLYFPKAFSIQQAEKLYRYYVEEEGLLGSGCLRKSPHQYATDDFCVEDGDVVVDIGCSEALFAFSNLKKASETYLFEMEQQWDAPLKASFAEELGSSVHVYNKFVSNKTGGNEIKLTDAIPTDSAKTFFIKMDIEGGERAVLDASEDFLVSNRVKLCCCLYHRQDDEQYIVPKLQRLGYKTSLSDGFVLTPMNGIHYPYFRKCLVRAKNYD